MESQGFLEIKTELEDNVIKSGKISSVEVPKKLEKSSLQYCCSECPFATDRQINLKRHFIHHLSMVGEKCSFCTFRASQGIRKHELIHHHKNFKIRTIKSGKNLTEDSKIDNSSGLAVERIKNETDAESSACQQIEGNKLPEIEVNSTSKKNIDILPNTTREQKVACAANFPNQFTVDSEEPLKNQKLTHKSENYLKCLYCSFMCKNQLKLTWHLMEHIETQNTRNKPLEQQQYCCTITRCPYKTTSLNSLKNHRLRYNHRGYFNCHYCFFICKSRSRLNLHLAIHEKRHDGDLSLRNKSHLKKSIKKYLKYAKNKFHRRYFQCVQCPFKIGLNRRARFIEHLKRHARITGQKCLYCSYSSTLLDVIKHQAVHLEANQPLRCKLCFLHFASKLALRQHSKMDHKQLTSNANRINSLKAKLVSTHVLKAAVHNSKSKSVNQQSCIYQEEQNNFPNSEHISQEIISSRKDSNLCKHNENSDKQIYEECSFAISISTNENDDNTNTIKDTEIKKSFNVANKSDTDCIGEGTNMTDSSELAIKKMPSDSLKSDSTVVEPPKVTDENEHGNLIITKFEQDLSDKSRLVEENHSDNSQECTSENNSLIIDNNNPVEKSSESKYLNLIDTSKNGPLEAEPCKDTDKNGNKSLEVNNLNESRMENDNFYSAISDNNCLSIGTEVCIETTEVLSENILQSENSFANDILHVEYDNNVSDQDLAGGMHVENGSNQPKNIDNLNKNLLIVRPVNIAPEESSLNSEEKNQDESVDSGFQFLREDSGLTPEHFSSVETVNKESQPKSQKHSDDKLHRIEESFQIYSYPEEIISAEIFSSTKPNLEASRKIVKRKSSSQIENSQIGAYTSDEDYSELRKTYKTYKNKRIRLKDLIGPGSRNSDNIIYVIESPPLEHTISQTVNPIDTSSFSFVNNNKNSEVKNKKSHFRCPECPAKLLDKVSYDTHQQCHKSDMKGVKGIVKCPVCTYRQNKIYILRHIMCHVKTIDKRIFCCPICDVKKHNVEYIRDHLKVEHGRLIFHNNC